MIPEILLETLSFLDRNSLEICELVSRTYRRTIADSNSELASRPMQELFVNCNDLHYSGGIVEFLRRPDEHAAKEVELEIGGMTDWSEMQTIAEETVTRTRNMYIECIYLQCVTCASPLISLWRDTFNGHKPCRAAKLHMSKQCWPDEPTDFAQLCQPFVAAKLGVASYDITPYGWQHLRALWPAWSRSSAQFVSVDGRGWNVLSTFIEQLLREPENGDRHYTVQEHSTAESLHMPEHYVQKFELADGGENYPASLMFHRFEREDRTVHKLSRTPIRTLDKPPKRSIPDPDGDLVEESCCDVYEFRNDVRRLAMRGYFWVVTIRSHDFARVNEHYVHCHWFNVVSF